MIVSDIAGTTRDAVDTKVSLGTAEHYVFIDTAGLRRKKNIKEEIERYSVIRTVTAVERADVVVVMIDASEGVTEQDAKIAGIAHERGKGMIIAVNKWDAIEKNDKTIYKHTNKITRDAFLYALCRNRFYFGKNRTAYFLNCYEMIGCSDREPEYAYARPVCSMRFCPRQLPCSSRLQTGDAG